jgi:tetratricopeptide (TPR) repeat protein
MEDRVALLLDALSRWPNNFPLVMYTSRVLLAEGDYRLALDTLDNATPPSDSAQVLLDEQRAIAILNLGHAAEANTALRPEARLSLSQQRFSLSLQLFIHSLIDLGEFDDARRHLGIVSSWHLDGSVRAAYLLEIARLAVATGESETAIEALNESLQLQPNTLVRLFRTLILVWQGEIGAAQRQAKALSPNDLKPEFASIPRLLNLITKQNAENLQRFHGQVSKYPLEQSGYLLLATYHRLLGNTPDACEALDRGRTESRSGTLLRPPWSKHCPTPSNSWDKD